MPPEQEYQYFPPELRDNNPRQAVSESRPSTSAGMASSSIPIPPRRPPMSHRNSKVEDLSTSQDSLRNMRAAPSSNVSKPKTISQIKALGRSLPPCSRQEFSSNYDDWFTLEECPGLDICSDCLKTVFGDTVFRPQFRRSPDRVVIGKKLQVRCDFADAWVRLAWLLTVQREMGSLSLIKMLINVRPLSGSDEACPGSEKAVRDWYSVRDRDGHFLRGFAICATDVKRLQVLFPAFRDMWVPLTVRPSSTYGGDYDSYMRVCSMRPALNNRYPKYIDCLVQIHEPAFRMNRMPDPTDFISMVRRKTMLHECMRDDMVRGHSWHFIPSLLPGLTVCEDCYDEVVRPALEANSDVAMRFNGDAQPIHNEGRLGFSCQLYSPRMRRIFQEAVEANDLRYLARKTAERKQAEDRLQERAAELRRHARFLRGEGLGQQAGEVERLQAEMDRLKDSWTQWE